MSEYKMPSRCAVCGKELSVTRLSCAHCSSELIGSFTPCRYCALDDRQKLFLDTFLKARGNIREVERMLSISYPTVKGLLDDLLGALFGQEKPKESDSLTPSQILDKLAQKEITADQAVEMLSTVQNERSRER